MNSGTHSDFNMNIKVRIAPGSTDGMVGLLAKARQQAGTADEKAVIRTFLTNYAMRDATGKD